MSQPRLTHAFADALPEFAVETTAAEFPDRRLIVLNDDLSRELGLDTDWLRSPEGVAWLTGAGGGACDGVRGPPIQPVRWAIG